VAETTVRLARLLGLPDQNLVHVRRGALLHDIGKMGVPDEILQKVGPLTDAEWVVMKRHPIMAYEMLAHIRYLEPALEIPYCHHEKWDGNGYPRGLQGDRIPLAARVFAVVDVYDALTANRPYRPAWTSEQALEYIRSQSGKQFEPAVAEAFLGMIGLQTEGATQGAGGTRGLLRRVL
jgi:putative nucleotidyltransferase with HDIG domain